MNRDQLLMLTLSAAVPLKIQEVRHWPDQTRVAAAQGLTDVIAEHGDDLQYGGKDCRSRFGVLVRALGLCAYQPGGVLFGGVLWCATHRRFGARVEWPCVECGEQERPPVDEPAAVPLVVSIDVAGDRL